MTLRELLLPKHKDDCANYSLEAIQAHDRVVDYVGRQIENLEASSVKVYCSKPDKANSQNWVHREQEGYDTHQGLIICVQPIHKPVSLSEIDQVLKGFSNEKVNDLFKLVERIKEHGIEGNRGE